jgi:hypothetical protein
MPLPFSRLIEGTLPAQFGFGSLPKLGPKPGRAKKTYIETARSHQSKGLTGSEIGQFRGKTERNEIE